MRYLREPEHTHGSLARPGLLLANLGTPDEPRPAALRRYLAQFLSDPRVVEIPPVLWRPILHGAILRVRPAKSAAKYASIWMPEGSPLLVHSRRQAVLLKGSLGERLKAAGIPEDLVAIELGMRYGQPSIPAAIEALRAAGCDRLLVLPLYPQYAASTSGSLFDAVGAELRNRRRVPGVRFVDTYHDDPGYVRALAARVNDFWSRNGRPDVLLMSFHGLPRFSLDRGDPYHCLCQKTARLLAAELGLGPGAFRVTFQSRFGRAKWLEPYTEPTLRELGRSGTARVDVVCPGFPADCLETLEEIAMEGRQAFLESGGKAFHYIPALNEHPAWIAALTDLAWRHLAGWLAPPPAPAEREGAAARARALGASR